MSYNATSNLTRNLVNVSHVDKETLRLNYVKRLGKTI